MKENKEANGRNGSKWEAEEQRGRHQEYLDQQKAGQGCPSPRPLPHMAMWEEGSEEPLQGASSLEKQTIRERKHEKVMRLHPKEGEVTGGSLECQGGSGV